MGWKMNKLKITTIKKKHFQFIHVSVQMEYEVDWMFPVVYVNPIEEGRKKFGGS